ncbi:hypothetical protein BHD05_05275 [Marisediminicola antarctica]|uniref:Transposase n=2 Tax=Marisediminicola antarctica TaxID=674079 RepID=A0A7L5AFB4_9MICO|nr:hypothetical protein BHD05_05275 [Marisediminicola antarctica]
MLAKEDRLANLQAANAKKTEAARGAVLRAFDHLVATAAAVNINAVAAEAGVSRGFIYSQPELRAKIADASKLPTSKVRSSSSTPNEASLTSRLETALDTIGDLKSENRELKQRIENLTAQLLDQELAI